MEWWQIGLTALNAVLASKHLPTALAAIKRVVTRQGRAQLAVEEERREHAASHRREVDYLRAEAKRERDECAAERVAYVTAAALADGTIRGLRARVAECEDMIDTQRTDSAMRAHAADKELEVARRTLAALLPDAKEGKR